MRAKHQGSHITTEGTLSTNSNFAKKSTKKLKKKKKEKKSTHTHI